MTPDSIQEFDYEAFTASPFHDQLAAAAVAPWPQNHLSLTSLLSTSSSSLTTPLGSLFGNMSMLEESVFRQAPC
ncbi:hypothetical protein CLOP_g11999 [Closterium sp. NIES-67]|nr:hypothetical protein CLOP_g11999 [Closterium sp. NIES-67]